jgi:hypothetical protein
MNTQNKQAEQIKCYKCKDYFDNVTIFTKNQEEDYKKEKWFCSECFIKECCDRTKAQAEKEYKKQEAKDNEMWAKEITAQVNFKEKEAKAQVYSEAGKAINDAILRTKTQTLADVIKIIDSLGEIRHKDHNELISIKVGEDFSTNSIEMLKKELKAKLQEIK